MLRVLDGKIWRFVLGVAICMMHSRAMPSELPAGQPVVLVPGAPGGPPRSSLDSITDSELLDHVRHLADDAMQGRQAGKEGGQKAGDYLVEQLRAMGLKPAGPAGDYTQPFGSGMRNILARLPGSDPQLTEETIVVGAHYDHVGIRVSGVPGSNSTVYNGANDNASGVAGVLEIAEAMAGLSQPPRRSILFALWDGEEQGLLGSRHFVANPTVPLQRIVFVIAMDMIGRVADDRFFFWGTGTATGLRDLIARNNVVSDLELEFRTFNLTRSDHQPFFEKNIPVLFPSSGMYAELHRPEDDVELINAEGMRRAAQLVHGIVHDLASRETNFAFVEASRSDVSVDVRRPADPDMSRPDDRQFTLGFTCQLEAREPGVAIVVKVAAKSPADLAGLHSADRIYAVDSGGIESAGGSLAELDARSEPFPLLIERNGRVRRLEVDPRSGVRRAPSLHEPTGVTHTWSKRKLDPPPDPSDGVRTLAGHTDAVRTLAFSPDGRVLATGSFDTDVVLWDLQTGQQLARFTAHGGPVNGLEPSTSRRIAPPVFSRDGRWLVVPQESPPRLWNLMVEDLSRSAVTLGDNQSEAQLISPDGRWLVTTPFPRPTRSTDIATYHQAVWLQLWDLASDKPAERPVTLSGHQGWATALGFSPDGRWLVTTGNRLARLWKLPPPGS